MIVALVLTLPIDECPHRLLRNVYGQRNVQPDVQDRVLGTFGIVERVIPYGILSVVTAAGVGQREAKY